MFFLGLPKANDDFDIEKVAQYGRKLRGRLIGHRQTSWNINNYENQTDDAFELYERSDVMIVKKKRHDVWFRPQRRGCHLIN